MPFGVNPRLTNLGIESETATGQQGAEAPFIDPRIEAMLRDQMDVHGQLTSARETDPKSFLSRLGSPGGIATAGVGVLASLLGAPEAGIPLLSGLLQGAGQAVESERAGLLKTVDDLEKKLASQQQRVATMLNTRPEHFVEFDLATGQYKQIASNEELGALAGVGTPISAVTKFNATKYNEAQKASASLWGNIFDQTTNPELKASALRHISDIYTWDLSDAEVKEVSSIEDEAALLSFLGRIFDPLEVRDVIKTARESGKSVLDFMHLLTRRKPVNPISFSDVEKGKFLESVNKVMGWFNGLSASERAEWSGRSFSELVRAAAIALEDPELPVWVVRKPEYKDGLDRDITTEKVLDAILSNMSDSTELNAFIKAYSEGDPAALDYITDSVVSGITRSRQVKGLEFIQLKRKGFESVMKDAGVEWSPELITRIMRDYLSRIKQKDVPFAEVTVDKAVADKAAEEIISKIKSGKYNG